MPEQTEQPPPEAVEDRSSRQRLTTRAKVETAVVCAVFVLYVVFALKLLLFSRTPGSERSLNLVPFATIGDYLFGGSSGLRRFTFGNVAGNILLFLPLGAYVSVLTRSTVARTMLIVASASVAVEVIQGVFGLGASDIDDVILNCLGGFAGVVLFLLFRMVLRDRGRVRTVIAVLSLVALPAVFFFLFAVRLRM
ncbi:MAG TPA: VanZ family protein [Microbacterium sp.]|uniref:VanZ family protein n=1 Tax=Microbacterium sp. TaxID=51671 RepID=UPI002B477414|nr:VanZ family protein [Microbacterium sp.]HKT57658.1 VanZ family protein [Microbacterium sp.]